LGKDMPDYLESCVVNYKMTAWYYIRIIWALSIWLLVLILPVACYASSKDESANGELTKHIMFAGYEWEVKSGQEHPGKNYWDKDNVWVDRDGWLHLKVSHKQGRWYCAELVSMRSFGYGTYQFQVVGAIDKLDRNLVLGLFVYPEHEIPNNEIDIEFAQWGNSNKPRGNYTVASNTQQYDLALQGDYTLHQFEWSSRQIAFQSYHGHEIDGSKKIANWIYAISEDKDKAPVPPVRVHMNFWLYLGETPTDNCEKEIVIRNFSFTPM